VTDRQTDGQTDGQNYDCQDRASIASRGKNETPAVAARHFDPHFEEVRGCVVPRWMARWNARVEFLLSVIELLFLSLTVEALQGKMCQNSLPLGVGRSLGAKISGEREGS